MDPQYTIDRRRFLTRLASGLFVASIAGVADAAFAETLATTPWVEEGPFYPYNRLPLDKDNDLVIVGNSLTPAIGTITHIAGRLLDGKGEPVKNAQIDLWQTDSRGIYLAQGASAIEKNFQGFGRFETDARGQYRFRTILPIAYAGRTAPHFHLKVTAKEKQPFTTQLFISGHPGNARDNVYSRIRSASERALVTRDFRPVADSKIGEVATTFDIVLGATPQEGERGNFGPGGGPGRRRF